MQVYKKLGRKEVRNELLTKSYEEVIKQVKNVAVEKSNAEDMLNDKGISIDVLQKIIQAFAEESNVKLSSLKEKKMHY